MNIPIDIQQALYKIHNDALDEFIDARSINHKDKIVACTRLIELELIRLYNVELKLSIVEEQFKDYCYEG